MKIKFRDRPRTYQAVIIQDYKSSNDYCFLDGELIRVVEHGMSDGYVYATYVNGKIEIIPKEYTKIIDEYHN